MSGGDYSAHSLIKPARRGFAPGGRALDIFHPAIIFASQHAGRPEFWLKTVPVHSSQQ
jgi:hypothetical protein